MSGSCSTADKGRQSKKHKSVDPKPSKAPKKSKLHTVSNVEIDRETVITFQQRLISEHANLPKPVVLAVPLNLLEPDTTIRTLSLSNVNVLFEQIKKGAWQDNICFFIVVEDDDKYRILNGNHRFHAMKKWNEIAEVSQRMQSVKCHVYTNLSYDQILLINAPSYTPLPHLPLTVLQKV